MMSPETGTLLTRLDHQRRHVQDEADLRRPVLPPGWSCLGLVRHLALDVERFWFRAVVARDRAVIDGLGRTGVTRRRAG
jgi:hypothetical protein